MFTAADGPTGQFTLLPMPREFFEFPSPLGGAAMLILNGFANNSDKLTGEHMAGIRIAASQALATFGQGNGALELYGVTDRTGSEAHNLNLSQRRADAALFALQAAMQLPDRRVTSARGLGERFADEYFQHQNDTRNPALRGVACYLWDSFALSQDPFLRLEIRFASPPTGGGPRRRAFLGALHMGRLRSLPPGPFTMTP